MISKHLETTEDIQVVPLTRLEDYFVDELVKEHTVLHVFNLFSCSPLLFVMSVFYLHLFNGKNIFVSHECIHV